MDATVVDAVGHSYTLRNVNHIVIEIRRDEPIPYINSSPFGNDDVISFVVKQTERIK